LKAILPIEGQRIIFLNFALYFYKTIVESIALFFYFHARYFYVEIKRNIELKFALYYYGCRSMDPLICSAKKCILCSILQQSLVEVWRIDIYLIDQKSIEIFLIDISPIGKSVVEVTRWPHFDDSLILLRHLCLWYMCQRDIKLCVLCLWETLLCAILLQVMVGV